MGKIGYRMGLGEVEGRTGEWEELLCPNFSLPGFPLPTFSYMNAFCFPAVWLSFDIRLGLGIEFSQSLQSTKYPDFS